MQPTQIGETLSPLVPRRTYFMVVELMLDEGYLSWVRGLGGWSLGYICNVTTVVGVRWG